ncbi:uncharacterized protein BO72DRAFT_495559 [Aspergillus fijiensis CBS 313.89]|uniref:Uncharacterized protein n=1 Tax=Aspergillus fijiensis CBS 313.89 TaxID=1448319 RepID=A0A8G1VYS4_9EURO|nr:uncharacterized protein BO72DRAFT_495559 [Aspergillus fijiensis CBS 313.89]RAK78030.1 hypothetical protein BO72DRAFT_495559 [Aspergillus fijiensis CBS 313.89]
MQGVTKDTEIPKTPCQATRAAQTPTSAPRPPHPQTTSPFLPRLPAETHLQHYGWLFGRRLPHYSNWWDDSAQRWRTLQHGWFSLWNIIVNDTCTYIRGPCERRETPLRGERVRYLNGSRADAHVSAGVHRAFARQTPRGGTRAHPPAHLALGAVLDSIRFPHASPRGRADYTRVWRALAATLPHLRKVRIRINPRFGEDEGSDEAGEKIATRSNSRQFIDDDDLPEFQDAWLEGMGWAVDRLSDLALFQIALHVDIYHHLRARVKLFLAARQRQQQQ